MTIGLKEVSNAAVTEQIAATARNFGDAAEPAIEAKAMPTFSQNFGVSTIALAPTPALNSDAAPIAPAA